MNGERERERERERMQNPSEYLLSKQKDGSTLTSEAIFHEITSWIESQGCVNAVPKHLVENYAQTYARYIQCEEAISQYGLISKSSNGTAIQSPFVEMSLQFQKQANHLWNEISGIIKENNILKEFL